MTRAHTVYVLVNEQNEWQYIGCTVNVKGRTAAHRKKYPHLRFEVLERESSFARERELIQQHQPPLNQVHTKNPKTRNVRNTRYFEWKRAEMRQRLAGAARRYWQDASEARVYPPLT